jgi:hypothetical protein
LISKYSDAEQLIYHDLEGDLEGDQVIRQTPSDSDLTIGETIK